MSPRRLPFLGALQFRNCLQNLSEKPQELLYVLQDGCSLGCGVFGSWMHAWMMPRVADLLEGGQYGLFSLLHAEVGD